MVTVSLFRGPVAALDLEYVSTFCSPHVKRFFF